MFGILDLLKDAELTQSEVAVKTGVPQSRISRLEIGKARLSPDELKDVAKALRVEPERVELALKYDDMRTRLERGQIDPIRLRRVVAEMESALELTSMNRELLTSLKSLADEQEAVQANARTVFADRDSFGRRLTPEQIEARETAKKGEYTYSDSRRVLGRDALGRRRRR